ncbi:hypothetical protein TI05_06100 [Achromatium sp. WMS3]|nr:hypothetical protein TI05_06100 [Achromatium sp. WMS3]
MLLLVGLLLLVNFLVVPEFIEWMLDPHHIWLTTYQFTCRMGRAKAKPIIIDALRTSAHPMYKTDRW